MTNFEGTSAIRGRGNPDSDDSLQTRVRALRLPDPPRPRRRIWLWLSVLVVFAALGAGGWYVYQAYQRGDLKARSTAEAPPVAANPMPPKSATPQGSALPGRPGQSEIALQTKGYIVPARQVLVSPKVSGMVVYLNIEEGRQVAQGEILAKIEAIEYEADANRAEAALELARHALLELERGSRPEEIAEARAALGEAQAQLVQLEAEWKRKSELRGTNILTTEELEMVESEYEATKKKVERLRESLKLIELGPREERISVARAEVRQREADLIKAKWRLGNCTIRAPITGTILKKNAEEGNIVDAHFFSGSASLCEMADLSDLEVDLMIQERDISKVQVGQRCQIVADAWPNRVYQGVVSRQMPIADRSKGAVSVRVKVTVPKEETGRYLKPEMGAVVTFLNGPKLSTQ